ncbi:DnaA N-terminal domain-containing protein [Candidatus Rickettsia colombianensi]|uniref:DnaA N-terminal domain-containing protein n=1 Tax=Candidatus Rickettsia colombianensi TaxID=1090944 RepID=UPI000EF1A7D7|nr:DnaA N-terminal domain-containing protein [Candidatus Rickettsia colombianensi]
MQLFYPLGLQSENIGIHKYLDTTKNQSYIPITGCILSHILSSKELSSLEKMYYILADSLSCINFNKGRNRSISLPATNWAERLSCSKSEVFVLQKSLEDKGYFIIHRDKNDQGQNKRNIITTTIPDKVFNNLKYEPDRFDLCDIDNTKTHHSSSDKLDAIDQIYLPTIEGKRQHLEKTKMFIRVPYEFLKQLNSNCSISATSKVIILYLFTKIYKSVANKYKPDDVLTHNSCSIVTSYQELQKELKLHRNSISKTLRTLEDNNFITRDQLVIKSNDDYGSRSDKSLWKISLLDVTIINDADHKDKKQQLVKSDANTKIHTYDQASDIDLEQILESSKEWECTKYDPSCIDSGQLYNKDFILENKYIKDIDYIDANHLDFKNSSINNLSDNLQLEKNSKKEFLENEQNSFSSESYNNSYFFSDYEGKSINCDTTQFDFLDRANHTNKQEFLETSELKQSYFNTSSERISKAINGISVKERVVINPTGQKSNAGATPTIKNTEHKKALRHFHPLSWQDVDTLNFRANREFSTNFVNQLLLKLYIKYPEKRFKNKFTFLSYMEKILKNEKHQGLLVNHTTFRFSCNINAEEKNILEYERFLSEIENSLDTSKEMQVKKKIAGRFSTRHAYEILTQVEFKTNYDNSFITALIPSQLDDLSERQIEILSEQLEAVYGMNGYYVQVVEDVGYDEQDRAKGNGIERKEAMICPKTTTSDIISNSTPIGILVEGGVIDTMESNTTWTQIREGLINELGVDIDKVWFSKAEAKECRDTAILTLTMPTKFMADWVCNNYSHAIRRFAGSVGIKRVEYGCR